MYFVSLDKFIPRYFILFDKMVNGIVSLISFSDLPLLLYKNAKDICVLVLYSTNLSTSLMGSSSFLVAFFVFSMYSIIPSANRVIFTFFFFQFGLLLFIFLFWFSYLGLPKLSWMRVARMEIFVLFLIPEEMLSVFHYEQWCLLWLCFIWPLLCWSSSTLCPLSGDLENLYHIGAELVPNPTLPRLPFPWGPHASFLIILPHPNSFNFNFLVKLDSLSLLSRILCWARLKDVLEVLNFTVQINCY